MLNKQKLKHLKKPEQFGRRFHLPLSVCLGYLLLVSCLFAGVTFSRYSSTSTGNTVITAAEFKVTLEAEPQGNLNLNSFDSSTLSSTRTFTVSSESEVSVGYDVTVTFPAALPNWVTVSVDGNAGESADNTTFVFSDDAWVFSVSGGQRDHILTIAVAPGLQTNDLSLEGIVVSITAEQID